MSDRSDKLRDFQDDAHWSRIFDSSVAQSLPMGRRAFLLFGLASLAASSLRLETLSLSLRKGALIVRLGERNYRVPLSQYGHAARYSVARKGPVWQFHARRLRTAPTGEGTTLDLCFAQRGGGWYVSATGGTIGATRPVALKDWLAGMAPLQFNRPFALAPLGSARFTGIAKHLALFADGSWQTVGRHKIEIKAADLRFTCGGVTWVPREAETGGWLIRADTASLNGAGLSARLDSRRKLTLQTKGESRIAIEVTRAGRSLLYFDGGVQMNISTAGNGASFDIPSIRLVQLLSRRARPTHILADLTHLSGHLDLVGAVFALRGTQDRYCEVAIKHGRAEPFAMDLALTGASLPVSDSDMTNWEFPGTPLRLNVGTPRPAATPPDRLHLAKAGSGGDPDPGDPVPGYPPTPDDPASSITLDASGEVFAIDAEKSLLRVLRARDLLDLKFGFSGLWLDGTGVRGSLPTLRVTKPGEIPAALVVHFGPQHIYERAEPAQIDDQGNVTWTSQNGDGPEEVVEARASGPSRLVFDLARRTEILLSVADLTAWSDLSLRVTGRAFKPDSDVQEQLDYVGIRPGVGRAKAMELIRASVEKDRDLENPDPSGDQYLETALELRYRTIISPPAGGSHPEAVESHPDELEPRGAQLFSTRLRPAATPVEALASDPDNTETPVEEDGDAASSGGLEDFIPRIDIAASEPRDLRVVWARGVDLGFLSGIAKDETNRAPWDGSPTPRPFPAPYNAHDMRELMAQTSIPALNALLGLREVPNQDKDDASEPEYQAVPGQVVPQPENYAFADDGKAVADAGVAVAKTTGPSRVVMTSQGASFASTSSFAPFAAYYMRKVYPDVDEPKLLDDWHPAMTLEKFNAHSILGRDIMVTVASKGFLFPFGHRASLIKLSERMFLPHASRKATAQQQDPTYYLVQRYFIVVGKPDKTFPAIGQPFAGRAGLALSAIRLLTTRSPDLIDPLTPSADKPDKDPTKIVDCNGRILRDATNGYEFTGLVFWPRVEKKGENEPGTDVLFEYQRDKEQAVLSAPLIFADNAAVHHGKTMEALAGYYRDKDKQAARTIIAPGKQHKFAPSQRRDDTAFETDAIVMSVSGRGIGAETPVEANFANDPPQPPANTTGRVIEQGTTPGQPKTENFSMDGVMEGADQPPFYPIMETATARVQPVNRFLGRPTGTVELGMNRLYVARGFDVVRNPSELFLDVKTSNLYLDLASDGTASGGIAKPNMRIAQLSRSVGPVGGPAQPLPGSSRAIAAEKAAATEAVGAALETENAANRQTSTALVTNAAEAGRFDPVEMLGGALNDAKLLGLISLKDVLKVVSFATGAPKLIESTANEFADFVGLPDLGDKDDAERLEKLITAAIGTIEAAINAFLGTVNDQLKNLQYGDVTLADLYPQLDKALRAVEPAATVLEDQFNASVEAVKKDPKKLAAEYAKITTTAGMLVSRVEDVADAVETIIDNPTPAIIGKIIKDFTTQWNRIQAAVKGELIPQIEAELKAYVFRGLLDELRAEFPVPGQDEGWQEFYAVFFGFPHLSQSDIEKAVKNAPSNKPGKLPAKEQLLKDVDDAFGDFAADKLDDKAALLLKHQAESLLSAHFGLPLTRAYEALAEFREALKKDGTEARQALIEKLVDLILKATEAILDLGYLQEVSDHLKDIEAFCTEATKFLSGKSAGLAAHFDNAEEQILKLKQTMTKARIPPELPDLDAARARVLIAAGELQALLAEGREVKGDLDEALKGVKCAKLSHLDPITHLFRLQARALDRVRDLGTAISDVQREVTGALATPAAYSVQRKTELDEMNAALKAAIGAIKGALGSLAGLDIGSLDTTNLGKAIDELKAEQSELEGYQTDAKEALGKFKTVWGELQQRIANIPADPEAAVKEINGLGQDLVDFISSQCKTLAGLLTMGGDFFGENVKPLAEWAEKQAIGAFGIAKDVNQHAIDVTSNILDLIDGNPAVKTLIRQELVESLGKAKGALETEQGEIEKLLSPGGFDIFKARTFVKTYWINKPPAILGVVELVRRLAEALLNGQLSAFVDLRDLERKLKDAVREIVPTRVNLSYDWGTEIGNYPSSSPIFEITEGAREIPAFWEIDGPVRGDDLKEKFYPKDSKDRPHLIIEAGASIDLLTGDREAFAECYLHPFTVNILPDFDIVTLRFTAASFGAGTGRSSKFRATPAEVEIGDKLSYVQMLASFLSGGGEQGPYYEITLLPPSIEVGYRLSLDQVPLGALMFYSISLNLSATLPLDDRDARFRFTFARRDLPFIISVPPYGGGGYVGFTANAKKITGFEASIEFGAMVGLSFGLIQGYGQITAGIYIAKTERDTTIIGGFVRAIGEGSIAIFSLAVYIEISLQDEDGHMTGSTIMSFTFKIKIVEFNFTFTATYNASGSEKRNTAFTKSSRLELAENEMGGTVEVEQPSDVENWRGYKSLYGNGILDKGWSR